MQAKSTQNIQKTNEPKPTYAARHPSVPLLFFLCCISHIIQLTPQQLSAEPRNFHFPHVLGVLTEEVLFELRSGEEYWALERRLCGQMARGEKTDPEEVISYGGVKKWL